MKSSNLFSVAVVAVTTGLAAAQAFAYTPKAGDATLNVNVKARSSLVNDDYGFAKSTGVTPNARTGVYLNRAAMYLGLEAGKASATVVVNAAADAYGSDMVENAFVTYKVTDNVAVSAGRQTINIGGTENTYDPYDVIVYSSWYQYYAGGYVGAWYANAIGLDLNFGPVHAAFQASDVYSGSKPAHNVQGSAVTNTGESNPALWTARLDMNLALGGNNSIMPLVQYASISNWEKQMSVGAMFKFAGLGGDVSYNSTMLSKSNPVGGTMTPSTETDYMQNRFSMSTDSSGAAAARNITSIQLMLKYDVELSKEMMLTPWVKYANLTDDWKVAGTAVKGKTQATMSPSSDIALGANMGMGQLSTGLFLLMQSGEFIKSDGGTENRSNMKMGLHVGAAI